MAVGDMNDAVFAALQRYQPQVNPSVLAATDMGMSRTTLGQLTNPNIIAGTGVLTPQAIASMLEQRLMSVQDQASYEAGLEYQDALRKYYDQLAALEVEYMRDEPKFSGDAYTTTLERVGYDPVVQSVLNNLIGTKDDPPLTPTSIRRKMSEALDSDGWVRFGFDRETADALVGQNINSVQGYMASVLNFTEPEIEDFKDTTLRRVDGEANAYRNEYRNWEETIESNRRKFEAEVRALGAEPEAGQFAPYYDPEAERLKFFKDIGLEGLALLPDPMDQYRVTRDDILAGMSDQTGRTAAEQALMRYADDPNVRTLTSRPMRVGEPTSDYAMAEAGVVGAQAPTATRKDVARDILSRLQAGRTQGGQAYQEAQRESTRAGLVADLLTRRMSAGGRTPFTDAMEQLYGYGAQA